MTRLFNPAVMLDLQRGYLFPWVPVLLAVGIGIYFGLRIEPGVPVYWSCGIAILGLMAMSMRLGTARAPPAIMFALVLIGFCLAGIRANLVAEPTLGFRYYGPIEGRIIAWRAGFY